MRNVILISCVAVAATFATAQEQRPSQRTNKPKARAEKRNAAGFTEAQVAYNEGVERQGAGDIDGAINSYTRALDLNPGYPEARDNRGQARLGKGDVTGAIADFTALIGYSPNSSQAYYNRGNAHTVARDFDRALADYTRAFELEPRDSRVLNNRAAVLRELKRPKEAAADYTRAIELAPTADYYYNRGVAHEEAGMLREALADYTRAIERNPDDAQARASRATLHLRANRDREADIDFAEAFRLDPSLRPDLENYIRQMRDARPRSR